MNEWMSNYVVACINSVVSFPLEGMDVSEKEKSNFKSFFYSACFSAIGALQFKFSIIFRVKDFRMGSQFFCFAIIWFGQRDWDSIHQFAEQYEIKN